MNDHNPNFDEPYDAEAEQMAEELAKELEALMLLGIIPEEYADDQTP